MKIALDSIKLVSIEYFGRSGSVLLSTLFDGHPSILSVPPGCLMNYVPAFRGLREILGASASIDAGKLEAFLKDSFPGLFSEFYRAAGYPIEAGIDPTRLVKNLGRLLRKMAVIDARTLFLAIHLAYQLDDILKFGREPRIIVWQKHTPMSAEDLAFASGFPHFIRLLAVRQPEETLEAHLRHYIDEVGMEPLSAFYQIMNQAISPFLVRHNSTPTQVDNCPRAVRFEDMHLRTHDLMRALAELLEIPWDPCLERSTLDGQNYFFPKDGSYITGLRTKLERRKEYTFLDEKDRKTINHVFALYYELWNYERLHEELTKNPSAETEKLIELPFRIESNFSSSEGEALNQQERYRRLRQNLRQVRDAQLGLAVISPNGPGKLPDEF